MRAQFVALLALAAPLHAIKITSPSKNDVVDLSAGVTLKWSTVSTDPTSAHLVLVNMAAGHTPYSKDLGEIDLSKGSLVVTEKDVPNDAGYQFNFESVATQNTGILAQSEQFEVKASGDDEESSSSSSASAAETRTIIETTSKATTASSTGATAAVTGTATTLSTVSSAATGSASQGTGSATRTGASSSTSTGAAAPTGMAVQGGSLIALVAGVAAVLA
jgi:hypothetical protein